MGNKERTVQVAKRAGVILGIALACLCVMLFTDIDLCPVRRIFRLHCPGCGGTRMVLRLLRLDLRGALRANGLLLVTGPVILGLLGVRTVRYLKTGQKTTPRWENRVWLVLAVLFVVYGVLRNLPWFSCLAPQ